MFIERDAERGRTPAGCNVEPLISLLERAMINCTPLGCGPAMNPDYKHDIPLVPVIPGNICYRSSHSEVQRLQLWSLIDIEEGQGFGRRPPNHPEHSRP
jgi:hypothetical protein